MAGMAETVIARVVTRYSVDMMYFTCVALSVRQISAALHLSLGVSSHRSGRHGTSFGSWRSKVSNTSAVEVPSYALFSLLRRFSFVWELSDDRRSISAVRWLCFRRENDLCGVELKPCFCCTLS